MAGNSHKEFKRNASALGIQFSSSFLSNRLVQPSKTSSEVGLLDGFQQSATDFV